jgi:hypothetical protein
MHTKTPPYNADTDKSFTPNFNDPSVRNNYLNNMLEKDPQTADANYNKALENLSTQDLALLDALHRGDGLALRSAIDGIDPNNLDKNLQDVANFYQNNLGSAPQGFNVSWTDAGKHLTLGYPPIYDGAP